MPGHARVSLADLLSTPIAPTASDAVALIVQLARSPQTGRPIAARLDASHVWLYRDGTVTLSPGLLPTLSEEAALLDTLLSRVDQSTPVPLGLMSIVGRAAGQKAGFSIPSLSAFAAALAPFQPADPAAAVSALVAQLDDPPVTPEAPVATEPVPDLPLPPPPLDLPLPPPPLDLPLLPPPLDLPQLPPPLDLPLLPPSMDLPLLPPPVPPATAVAPEVTVTAWRPSAWHVAGAIAATALASVVGGEVGRRGFHSLVRLVAQPATSSASMHEAAAPESGPDMMPAAATRTAPAPRTGSLRAKPVTPRPARLIDRRAVQADAVFSPSFAPNGSAVFFHAESGIESALKRAEPDDSGELRVATIVDDGARNFHVRLSPDGTQVAFDSDRDGERGVYVADANGRGVRRVSGDGFAAMPTWAPDGRRLAFLRAEPQHPEVWNLWLLDRGTGRQTRITSFQSGQVRGGTWFRDGRRLAYSHEDRLTIHDLVSGQVREFASPLKGRLVRTPAVSPDGRWIMFQVHRDGAWLLDVEGGVTNRVLQDPTAEEFAWSPDGRRVAYHSRRSGGWNLWTMAAP